LSDIHKSLRFHFSQLASHRGQLKPEDGGTYRATDSDNGGKTDHPSVAFPNPIYKRLLGYGLLGIAATAMFAGVFFLNIVSDGRRTSFDWFNQSRWSFLPRRRRLVLGIILAAIAVGLIWQGIGLLFGFEV
jgi:hypothetical protein